MGFQNGILSFKKDASGSAVNFSEMHFLILLLSLNF